MHFRVYWTFQANISLLPKIAAIILWDLIEFLLHRGNAPPMISLSVATWVEIFIAFASILAASL
jgi:hypothetical protein